MHFLTIILTFLLTPVGGPGFELEKRPMQFLDRGHLNSSHVEPQIAAQLKEQIPVPLMSNDVVSLTDQMRRGLSASIRPRSNSIGAQSNSTYTSIVFSQIGKEMEEFNKNYTTFLKKNMR